jgi:F-type H+-transporting ATPase subunit b
MFEAEFWVAVAFFVFVAFLGYLGAHRMILASLDQRRDKIKSELDEARRLREDAEKLLAEYRRRQQDAESEARTIISSAQAEAERIADEAHARLEELIARRTAIAQTKIAQAEAQALADVRAAAADAAVAAAEKILRETAKGKVADALLAKGIEDVKAKLH